jgi:hypothetical protein
LKKAFEHVDHNRMIAAARSMGYPMHTLRASLLSYVAPRQLTFLGYASAPVWPTRGIAAGSATATFELWLLLAPALKCIRQAHPRATLSLHVDDLSATITESDEIACASESARLSYTIDQQLRVQRGLAFAPDKGYVIASSPAIAKAAVELASLPVQAATAVRRLGVDYHLEHTASRRSNYTPVQASRFKEAVKRAMRLKRFFPNGAPGLYAAGISPVVEYGSDYIRSSPALVQALQRKVVACGRIRPFGTPAKVTLLAYPTSYDPGYRAIVQPIFR